ncbi:MAG: UDP-N-acetylglucosamine 2-epimerase [Coriobacteriia bacterium]|nr:UDP-N-acetylglucosamine 2-epimerase [Coriobacteriia bacterium]
MSIRVTLVTTSRADYGLLYPLMMRLRSDARFALSVVVTGAHLAEEHGLTVREVEADGMPISHRVVLPAGDDSRGATARAIGAAVPALAAAFEESVPDLVVLLGDRFETFSAATAALVLDVPIAHIHGGEVTLGSLDDPFRHAITKMSTLHFTAAEEYRRRVVQMGAPGFAVFNTGALAVDNVVGTEFLTPEVFAGSFGVVCDETTLLLTFHPVTRLGDSTAEADELLRALDSLPRFRALFTTPNADAGGRALLARLEAFRDAHPGRVDIVTSLGRVGYLSAAKNAAAVVGNSSSGLIEVPALGVPSVDIGTRQAGRVRPESVIHADPDAASIAAAIERATSPEHRAFARTAPNPYGDGHAAERMAELLADRALVARAREAGFSDLEFEGPHDREEV